MNDCAFSVFGDIVHIFSVFGDIVRILVYLVISVIFNH